MKKAPHSLFGPSIRNYRTSILETNYDFTSDELISMMPNPYKKNLEMLKLRVKGKNQRML